MYVLKLTYRTLISTVCKLKKGGEQVTRNEPFESRQQRFVFYYGSCSQYFISRLIKTSWHRHENVK